MVLRIFKIVLCLRDRRVFMWQSVKILNVFNSLTLKKIFWKRKTFFKRLEYRFLVEGTKTETTSFLHKTVISETNVKTYRMVIKNRPITKNGVLAVTTSIFWKFCFSLRTSYKELIWCTNDPNAYICTFCKHLNFIWRSKSLLQFVILFVLPFSIFHNR